MHVYTCASSHVYGMCIRRLVHLRRLGTNVTVESNEEGFVFDNVCWEEGWSSGGAPPGVAVTALHASDPPLQLRNGWRTQVAAAVQIAARASGA